MTAGLTQSDFEMPYPPTHGQAIYRRHGIQGVRGLAEAGFPVLLEVGLPVLQKGLSQGISLEEAGAAVLLHLMCAVTDTNLIARSDIETQQTICSEIRQLLTDHPFPDRAQLEALDKAFIQKNLSPGGSADLLAATYFLYFLNGQ